MGRITNIVVMERVGHGHLPGLTIVGTSGNVMAAAIAGEECAT
jgi:hypothetical protein